jgi:hypothetical protein
MTPEFLAEVANHKVEVLHSQGVYRHIKCGDGTFENAFNVVTYPNHLCFSGDVGCFVFERTYDMLAFFNHKTLNPSYWASKVISGITVEFDQKSFVANIRTVAKSVLENLDHAELHENELTVQEATDGFLADIEELILEEYESQAEWMQAIDEFYCDVIPGLALIEKFDSEAVFDKYTDQFIWCCNSLIWVNAQLASMPEATDKALAFKALIAATAAFYKYAGSCDLGPEREKAFAIHQAMHRAPTAN